MATTKPKLRYFNVKDYNDNHQMQLDCFSNILRRYRNKLHWQTYRNIMDLGCGLGDYTYNYLLPLIHPDGKITAIDISEEMIKYARTEFFDDHRLTFKIMDGGNRSQCKIYAETFDVIFSSSCLHWIPNQRRAIENIFSMLQNGGSFAASFVASTPIWNLAEIILKHDKWKLHVPKFDTSIFPYQNDENPVKTLKTILTETGFVVEDCVVIGTVHTFSNIDCLLRTINAAVPIAQYLAKHLLEEYNEDCLSILKTNKSYKEESDGKILLENKIFNVLCRKPERMN